MDNDKWQIDKDRDKQVLLFIIVRLDSHHRYVPCLSISGVCETWIMGLRWSEQLSTYLSADLGADGDVEYMLKMFKDCDLPALLAGLTLSENDINSPHIFSMKLILSPGSKNH